MERPYKRLIQHPDFEVPVPTREAVLGFFAVLAVAVVMVASLLLFVWWVKQ